MLSLSLLLILISLLSLINRTKQSLPITWSNRLGITLTPISTGVWGAERSFIWNNIDVGGRSVICRMNDGSLLVHSPVNYTSELGSALTALGGNVGYIVSPNFEHLKYASQWSEVFPSAKLVACPGLPTKKTKYTDGMKWDIELGHSSSWADDSIDTIFFDCESVLGQPFFNEVIFYHKKSKTCFLTDVYWNYPASDLPNYYGEEETGQIHQCSKVPVESKLLPSINVPFGTKAWKFGNIFIIMIHYSLFLLSFL